MSADLVGKTVISLKLYGCGLISELCYYTKVSLCTSDIQNIEGPVHHLLKSVERENFDFFGEGETCFRCVELGLRKVYKASL
jgi:hypothetical protein